MEKEDLLTDLTSGEIAYLWMMYQYETMSKCGLLYFLRNVEDRETKELLEEGLGLSNKRIDSIKEILTKENYPIPEGFTNSDVDLKAPRLFSDVLYLEYILNTLNLELTEYNLAYMEAVKLYIQKFYVEVIQDTLELEMQAKELAKDKGIFIKIPRIPTPKTIEYVEKDSFLAGWFGGRRPLLAIEISHLAFNAKRNALGQAVITGFSQVAKSKEVRRFFERGREIAGKQMEVFANILHDDYLSSSSIFRTAEVTDSTEAPFSDKLMMTFITTLIGSGMGNYGSAMSMSARRDLGVQYTRLMAEIAQYADDGAEILIKNGWMEQPPMAADRKGLAK